MLMLVMIAYSSAQDSPRQPRSRVIPEGVVVHEDLEYVPMGHARQRLDLYLPENNRGQSPIILWIHGGGWSGGDKSSSPAIPFVTRGFAVAAMNYRLSQHAIFPAQIHDCKAAIRWLRKHAHEYGLDSERIGVWGSSAGGQLVALLGTTRGHPELEGDLGNAEFSSEVQAVVDWFGPTDFLTVGSKETRTKYLGIEPLQDVAKAKLASPLYHVSKQAAPFLIMHGDKDATVPISQSETFALALQSAGIDAPMMKIEDAGHGGSHFSGAEQFDRIEQFFKKHLRPTSP